MAPSLEMLEGRPVAEAKSFAIILNTPERLDLNTFDTWAQNIGEKEGRVTYLKWLVRGDKMIVFSKNYQHKDLNDALNRGGNTDPLHAAGDLNLLSLGETSRELSGWSISLIGELSKSKSDSFTRDVLLGKLGEGFEIPDHYRGTGA